MATLAQPVRLEVGTSEDLSDVMRIMETAFGTAYGEAWTRSQCAGILPMAGVSLTIARDRGNGHATGFSLVRSVADESELLLIAVLPSHHRQGVGGQLLGHFLDRARKAGLGRVHLEVRDGNPAVELYRAAGFVQVGRRRNYYHTPGGESFDALTLALQI